MTDKMTIEEALDTVGHALTFVDGAAETGDYDAALSTLRAAVEENAALKAELERARPLLEAVEKAIPDFLYRDAYGLISGSGASVLLAALAYRAAKEGKK